MLDGNTVSVTRGYQRSSCPLRQGPRGQEISVGFSGRTARLGGEDVGARGSSMGRDGAGTSHEEFAPTLILDLLAEDRLEAVL